MQAVDFSVVVDVALTETAREATYFLPAATQYEKVETTFFSASFPDNWICVRPPRYKHYSLCDFTSSNNYRFYFITLA